MLLEDTDESRSLGRPDVVLKEIHGRYCPVVREGIRDIRLSYGEGLQARVRGTYVHLGRKAASTLAPEGPSCFLLRSAETMEISMVTGW
jgi:hypothetical protein